MDYAHKADTPEGRLWKAVLWKAFFDLQYTLRAYERTCRRFHSQDLSLLSSKQRDSITKSKNSHHVALRQCLHELHNPWFHHVCHFAGRKPEGVLAHIRREISKTHYTRFDPVFKEIMK